MLLPFLQRADLTRAAPLLANDWIYCTEKEKSCESFDRFKSTLRATRNRKGLLSRTSGQLDIVLLTILITLVMFSNFFQWK